MFRLHINLLRRMVFIVPLVTALSRESVAEDHFVPQPAQQANVNVCSLVDAAAQKNDLPVEFFTRLIWFESGFQSDSIGRLTHSGERALGIAQFMPGTAIERGLFEPFDPNAALPKSAEFLRELRDEFGNLGLAAAAYNAGPQRVRDFVAGLHPLPAETINYVQAITKHSVDEWLNLAQQKTALTDRHDIAFQDNSVHCQDVIASLKEAPISLGTRTANVPSWCRLLHHPNTQVCGSVHEVASATAFLVKTHFTKSAVMLTRH
jgi:Transglycosylase SLT domain